MARHASEPVLVPWRLALEGSSRVALTDPQDLLQRAQEDVGVHILLERCPRAAAPDGDFAEPQEVVTIRGTMWQKRQAVRAIIERLLEHQGVANGSGSMLLLLPSSGFDSLQDPSSVPSLALVPQQLQHPQALQEETQRMLQERVQQQLRELKQRSAATAQGAPVAPTILRRPSVQEEPPPQTLAPSERRTNGHVQPGPVPLALLLPSRLVEDFLVPQDHLAEVARRCAIHLDVAGEDPPGQRQVSLYGDPGKVGMALMQLQMRSACCPWN
ncbi:hypothetical protein AK812_SmicGene7954 [Symbiodinium microadriaticum]|uniref:Uncharacterized protein n=1 Tax=Symbiodinium microadriaticum TaxID=2951 RepID=A0A1Q9EMC1_SYMMI|nr:hypothetical protein AK812_SmicGene7954 [Symbiodinium microadriaticum]